VDLGNAVWAFFASFAESGMAKAERAFPKKKLKVERVAVRDQMARAWVGWPSPGRWRVQVSELVPGAYTRVCMVGSIIVVREWVCPVVVNGRSSHVVCPAAGPVTCLLRRVRLAAPGHVARASGVLWTGRGMEGVQGGRCGMSGTRAPTIRVGWPDNRYAGPAASVRFRAGTVRSPTDSGPAAPACVLRGGRPITGKTLPTGPKRQRLPA
jgi:hypothetical protein